MLKRFLLLLLIVIGWGGSFAAQAAPWPYYSAEIELCETVPGVGDGPCSALVYYKNTQTIWRDIPDNTKSFRMTQILSLVGVHCEKGRVSGEFRQCHFDVSTGSGINSHSPGMVGPCRTTAPDNFIIQAPSYCIANSGTFGWHRGAGPGAECVILGKVPNGTNEAYFGNLDTPYGALSSEMVANSGNTYCGKALAPSVDCNIAIANGGILDHGVQAPSSTSERSLDVTVDCGASPVFSIVDETIKFDNDRIQSDLSLTPNGAAYLLKSVLTSTNASAGN
ncbi:hypothetical protein AAZR93_21460, partial [Providencia sp. Je.9.19]